MAKKSKVKSFLSKAKSFVSSAYSSLKSTIKGGLSKIGGQTAAVGTALGIPKTVGGTKIDNRLDYNNPQNVALQQGGVRAAAKVASAGIPSYATSSTGYSSPAGPTLPKTISGGKQAITSPLASYGGPDFSNFPTTISATSLSGGTSGGDFSRGVSGGGTNTGATQSSSPYSVPSYSSYDPGNTDTTGLASGMAGYYTRKEDGTFEPVTKDPFQDEGESSLDQKMKLYNKAYEDSQKTQYDDEVDQARADRRAAQQALLAPTAELNAIIAQGQRDTLQLRQTAQKEGVVEAVYGAQAAAINYNTAIRALPLQSFVAALQGNLELADSYLNELVDMQKEQIKRQFDYSMGLYSVISKDIDEKERRVYDRLVEETKRQYKAEDELVDYKVELVAAINSQGDPNGHVRVNAVMKSKDKVSAAKAAGDITKGVAGAGGLTTYTAGQNPTVDAWAERIQSGAAKITDIPASQTALRNQVTVALNAMGNSSEGKPTTTELGKAALQTARDLLTKFNTEKAKIGGALPVGGLINVTLPGTKARDFAIQFDTLKSQLSLDAVKYLKGQGAVSDAERALLASSVSALNRNQSKAEFERTLKAIVSKLEGSSSVLHSPDGLSEVNVSDLTPAELAEAKANGWK